MKLLTDVGGKLRQRICWQCYHHFKLYTHESGILFAVHFGKLSGMETRNLLLISNPNAGRGGVERALEVERFCKLLKARGVKVEVANTGGPGDAARLAERAAGEGVREIVVSGGDGTINEALQGLIGKEVKLGVWPRGTANVLARELRLPFDVAGAVEIIARAQTKKIFVGCATIEKTGARRYFFLMAGIGLDASIVNQVSPRLKRRMGEAAFWYSGLEHLARWQPTPFHIETEGKVFTATFAAIGKAAHYGGNLSITPRASLFEARFEICMIDSHSRLRYLRLLSHAMRGGVSHTTEGIRFIETVRARADGDALVQADGELIGQLPMSFDIAPAPIEIIVSD